MNSISKIAFLIEIVIQIVIGLEGNRVFARYMDFILFPKNTLKNLLLSKFSEF
jgi:hypothetical protein